MKTIHAVNAALWHPGSRLTNYKQTNQTTTISICVLMKLLQGARRCAMVGIVEKFAAKLLLTFGHFICKMFYSQKPYSQKCNCLAIAAIIMDNYSTPKKRIESRPHLQFLNAHCKAHVIQLTEHNKKLILASCCIWPSATKSPKTQGEDTVQERRHGERKFRGESTSC